MTPAIDLLEKHKAKYNVHHYEHDANNTSYGEEAVEKTGQSGDQVFKTLIISDPAQTLYVCVIPVFSKLDLKKAAKYFGVKKAMMGDAQKVMTATGYVLGGVSPLGQKKKLKTIIDESAQQFDTIFISAGKRGLELELAPQDLATLCNASFNDIKKEA